VVANLVDQQEKKSASTRTRNILAPKVYIKAAIHSLNNIMPHPQQTKTDAQNVAEKINSKRFEIILRGGGKN
jgi:hypothetical protein